MSESFAARLRHYRELRGLSQKRLASMAGVDSSLVSKWERNSRGVRRENVLRVAEVMRLEPDERRDLLLSAGYTADGDTRPAPPDPRPAMLVEAVALSAELLGVLVNDKPGPAATGAILRQLRGVVESARGVAA